jgi:hypothetical protein
MSLRGRIPRVNQFSPESWGRDDITGLPVMHNDLIRQMEYIGTELAWTGFMVHYKDADQPQPQLMPVRIPPDPVPIRNPRIFYLPQLPTIPSGLVADVVTGDTIQISWDLIPLITNYVVSWVSIWAKNQDTTVPTSPYTITGLAPGNSYAIQVASTSTTGQSAFCNSIIVTTV